MRGSKQRKADFSQSASKWYLGLPRLFLPYSMASAGQRQIQAMQWVQSPPQTGLPFWIVMLFVGQSLFQHLYIIRCRDFFAVRINMSSAKKRLVSVSTALYNYIVISIYIKARYICLPTAHTAKFCLNCQNIQCIIMLYFAYIGK